MTASTAPNKRATVSFRGKLLLAMMLIVLPMTLLGLYFAQRNVAATAERDLKQNFQAELSWLHRLQELRHAALTERCRALAAKPRIHAALEDNALDLLYPSAKDELRDLMEGDEPAPEQATRSLHARFYRFLDSDGAVLPPPNPKDVGALSATAENQLTLKNLPDHQQIGYLTHVDLAEETTEENTAEPIFSSETGEVISALVVGFKPFEVETTHASAGIRSGIWVNRRLHLPSLSKPAQDALASEISNVLRNGDRSQNNFNVRIDASPHLLFYQRLNPDSIFPPAY